MNTRNLTTWSWMVAATLLLLGGTGCAYKVVRPPPLVVGTAQNGPVRVVQYPAYVLVHDSESFWDAHQIKDNLIGLMDGEVVSWFDRAIDVMTPGPRHLPLENSIEWIKNSYAQLPDCAPVRIVDGFFSAVGIEKTTLINGATKIVVAPADPLSYLVFTRVIYLTDWVQETLGEMNAAAGHLTLRRGPLVPLPMTAPINRGMDWAQSGAVTLYIRIFREVSNGLDSAIDGCEAAWGRVVWCFVWRR